MIYDRCGIEQKEHTADKLYKYLIFEKQNKKGEKVEEHSHITHEIGGSQSERS